MDCIRLISPSGKITARQLKSSVIRLEKIQYNVKYSKSILDKNVYFAGTVQRRVKEIEDAFYSDENIIFCCRGGYGSMELLDHLDWSKIMSTNKTLIGYSDITALLLGFYAKGYKKSLIHGPMPGFSNFDSNDLLKKCITCSPYSYKFGATVKTINDWDFKGEIVGGNLRIMCHMIGTKYELNTEGKILFIEDVNERAAAIYNMLLHLEMCGKFTDIKALLIGEMHHCQKYIPLLELFLKRLKIPILYRLPLGHGKQMIPIKIGSTVAYSSKKKVLFFTNE